MQASGFSLYDANKLTEFAYGKSPNIVDQAGLEKLAIEAAASGEPIKRPSDGGPVKSVAFVQCAGQRDHGNQTAGKHLPYCSGFCCNASIKQAMYFKDANPDIDTVVIYTDLRTPGNSEDFYRSAQAKGVIFTKGKVTGVEPGANTSTVKFRDLILDEDTAIVDVDLVVLATGQVPNSGVDIDLTPEQQEKIEVKPISILNLNYRQGKDLPQLKSGFADSHFICFPYETRRTGIYAAGPVRRPMDIAQAIEDATGATLKAIQAAENAELGRARASALGRPVVPDRAARRLHAMQALHRRVPVRRDRRGREKLPGVQRIALPPLRHLHGRVSGARDFVRELFVRYGRRADQGRRRARRVLRKAAHPGARVRERRLPGARHGGHAAQ